MLIAAVYDADGALSSVRIFAVEANDEAQTIDTEIDVKSGDTCKLMLVDDMSYAPLCAAWSVPA